MTHTLYVVRHKATGRCLPQSFTKGSTWWEPEQAPPTGAWPAADVPRLFLTERAAKNFIIMWAKGRAVTRRQEFYFEGQPDDSERLEWEPVPGRSRDQLEAVQIYLKMGADQ